MTVRTIALGYGTPNLEGATTFQKVLGTPSGKIAVCSVHDERLLELEVGSVRTRVVVIANDATESNSLEIFVSPELASGREPRDPDRN
jgi:hypothetical protein